MSLPADSRSFTYSVFGLRLQTDRPLAGLVPLAKATDTVDLKADTTYEVKAATTDEESAASTGDLKAATTDEEKADGTDQAVTDVASAFWRSGMAGATTGDLKAATTDEESADTTDEEKADGTDEAVTDVASAFRRTGVHVVSAFGRTGMDMDAATTGDVKAATTDEEKADVTVRFAGFPQWAIDDRATAREPWYVSPVTVDGGRPFTTVWKLTGGHLCLELADGISFLVDAQGCDAWVALPAASAFDEAVSHILGPILGWVLRLRGSTCLHASAVCIGDGAIAFAGPQAAGKSTLAAAFGLRGYPVLSDDLVPLVDRGDTILAQPGYPRLCLRPQAKQYLEDLGDRPARLAPDADGEHVSLDLTESGYTFQREPAPLVAIYFMAEPSADACLPTIDKISGREALMRLVGDTWATRVLDSSMRAAEFDLLSRLIPQLRVRLVRPSTDPTRLSRLCDLIIEDVEQGS